MVTIATALGQQSAVRICKLERKTLNMSHKSRQYSAGNHIGIADTKEHPTASGKCSAMNDKRFTIALLIAIVATLIALAVQQYFPPKRLLILPQSTTLTFFHAGPGADGKPAAFWLDQTKNQWRCAFPAGVNGYYFPCSFNIQLSTDGQNGLDLSDYTRLNAKIIVSGKARKLRFSMRNFHPAYSTPSDGNSGKFMSVNVPVADMQHEFSISLNEFTVAAWWLDQLNIARHYSQPERDNIILLGIDYAEDLAPGNYDITVEKLELVGEWISTEDWYLLIIACWLLGLFSYVIAHLVQLREQTRKNVQVINALSQSNTQLQLETDKFRRLSTVDPLTQAYNRFGIDQIISSLLNRNPGEKTQHNNPDFALIVIDIDHFKRINDRRGHDTGDRVLQRVATIIAQGIGRRDFFGRWGGEEFIVILPDSRKEFALALAEKLRLIISEAVFDENQPLAVTASFGISDRLPNEDFASCFKRADVALYNAKAQGRNCSVMAADALEE